ncbi:hypothetical protein QVA66_07315 [Staphylococcus chromogenes]|nr:hypothetical protein [Staphylococcus chromogenes]
MSEQQLTVAELMARAAKERGETGEAPRRRRRRSLEDGGVSVAELTGSIPRVKSKPVEARHTAVPIDAPAAPTPAQAPEAPAPTPSSTPAASTPEAPAAQPIDPQVAEVAATSPAEDVPAGVPVTVVSDKDPVRLTTDIFPAQQVDAAPEPAPATPVAQPAPTPSAADTQETSVIPVVEEKPVELAPAAPEENTTVDVVADDDEDDGISLASVISMAVLGVVIGIGLFIGFKILWASVSPILVAVLAIAMTLGLVGVVHALRTERDGMSMVLAGITGLAVTFGPMLIANL